MPLTTAALASRVIGSEHFEVIRKMLQVDEASGSGDQLAWAEELMVARPLSPTRLRWACTASGGCVTSSTRMGHPGG